MYVLRMIDKAKRNARQYRWRDKNPEKTKAAQKRWFDKNPERAREVQRAAQKRWRLLHPEAVARLKRKWELANPEKAKAADRRVAAKKRKKQEALMGRPQPDVCEICSKKGKVLCADHCHRSGRYRGWLCRNCNIAIGNAYEDPNILRKMADWLEKHKEKTQ